MRDFHLTPPSPLPPRPGEPAIGLKMFGHVMQARLSRAILGLLASDSSQLSPPLTAALALPLPGQPVSRDMLLWACKGLSLTQLRTTPGLPQLKLPVELAEASM